MKVLTRPTISRHDKQIYIWTHLVKLQNTKDKHVLRSGWREERHFKRVTARLTLDCQ